MNYGISAPRKTHRLKVWPGPYQAIVDGDKRFEYREVRDRSFGIRDILILEEWDPKAERYSGRKSLALVRYTLTDSFGIPPGYIVMSLDNMVWNYNGLSADALENEIHKCILADPVWFEFCKIPWHLNAQ